MGTIPMNRVMERLDRLNAANDPAGARRHLLYWLEEARLAGDERAQLTICNELMGMFRLAGDGDNAIKCAEEAIALVDRLGIGDTVAAGTVHVNCGTVYTAFGRPSDAMKHYESAAAIYEARFATPEQGGSRQSDNGTSAAEGSGKPAADARVGSLYNNMAACLTAAGEYGKAEKAYGKALSVMETVPGSEPERAITMLNLADLLRTAYGLAEACERIDECTQKAHDLLETEGVPRDTNYAQVCGKCAPVFEFYGWFAYAAELRKRETEYYKKAD